VPHDDLWQELDVALTLKRTRSATLARLNHLLLKRFPGTPDNYLTQDNCEVWRESRTADQLRCYNPGHDRAEPQRMTGPVVVFERGNERYMFDGTNRLNVWLRDGDRNSHDVIVLKIRVS
jgi:hypothetical protein